MAVKVNLEAKRALKKTLISVDIQPEYYHKAVKSGGFNDNILHGLISALNSNSYSKKVVLYNGADTLGMISLNDYQYWLLENGLEEDRLNECLFYDKGYAFFRFMMDSGIDEDDIVLLVKFMQANNINDSRQITETGLWDKFIQEYNKLELRELLEDADDCINIPDLMDWLAQHVRGDNIELIGGSNHECLAEVCVALKALGINYTKNDKLVYEGEEDLFGRIVAAPVSTVKELRESYGIECSKSGFDDVGEVTKEDLAKVNAIINNKALPEVAEKGKAYVVHWADGRGKFACKKKSYLSKWLKEQGSWACIVSIKYEDPKKLKVISESTSERIVRYFKETRMYHGSSSEFDKPANGLIYWVTPSQELALDYANGSVVHRKNGKDPILYIHDVNVKHPALVTDDHSPILRLMVRWWENSPNKETVNKEELKYIRDRIVDLWHNIGLDNSDTAVYNHWNMSGIAGNNLLMDYLNLLGYDSIHYKEGGFDTYGLFRVGTGSKINLNHIGK